MVIFKTAVSKGWCKRVDAHLGVLVYGDFTVVVDNETVKSQILLLIDAFSEQELDCVAFFILRGAVNKFVNFLHKTSSTKRIS